MRAADQLIQTLLAAGTDTIFSLSGNQIMPIYDAAIDYPIQLVHTRHEAGAVYMADGYARSSDKIGVALVTAAPGFTNALGPLYANMQTQTPMLLLSGDSPTSQDKMMPFQQLDQPEIARHLVKESWRVNHAERLADDIAGGIALARSGRPGPVHISLPQDMLNAEAGEAKAFDPAAFKPETSSLSKADLPSILNVVDGARMPLIITGPSLHPTQASGVADKLMATLNIPVICMQSPRGLNDPALGKLKTILQNADALILIDKDVDFTLGAGNIETLPAEHIAMIAANAESIAHASTVLSGRLNWGCIGDPITAANALMEASNIRGPSGWCTKVKKALSQRPKAPASSSHAGQTGQMTAHALAEAIAATLNPLPKVIIDGGEVGQWAQSVLPADQTLTNGLSGAIGGSIPQAIGMAMANPSSPVVAFMGDGTAGFYLSELDTARRLNLPITFIIANDQRWGAEVEIQHRLYGADRAKGCALDDITSYDNVAKAMGLNGEKTETIEQFISALIAAQKSRKPTVINAMIKGLPAPSF